MWGSGARPALPVAQSALYRSQYSRVSRRARPPSLASRNRHTARAACERSERACVSGTPTEAETCPISTEGGTRRVQLVREGGGRGGGARLRVRHAQAGEVLWRQRRERLHLPEHQPARRSEPARRPGAARRGAARALLVPRQARREAGWKMGEGGSGFRLP